MVAAGTAIRCDPARTSIEATSWAPTWPAASIHTATTPPVAKVVFREEFVACWLAHGHQEPAASEYGAHGGGAALGNGRMVIAEHG